MKMHIEMDMTPKEARALMGLPDIAPIQQQMVEQMQAKMAAALEAGDPEAMAQAWGALLSGAGAGTDTFQKWQKALWDSASAMAGKTGSR